MAQAPSRRAGQQHCCLPRDSRLPARGQPSPTATRLTQILETALSVWHPGWQQLLLGALQPLLVP